MARKPTRNRPYTTAGASYVKVSEALIADGYEPFSYSIHHTDFKRIRNGRESIVRVPLTSNPNALWTHAAWKHFVAEYQLNIFRVGTILHMESTL